MRLRMMFLLAFTLPAQELRVTSGLASYQVLQRDARDRGSATVQGTAAGIDGKAVEARITGRNMQARTVPLGAVQNGSWSGTLTGLTVGGPYEVEIRAAGAPAVRVTNVLVGDLWVLAGQSNMEGVGDLVNTQPPDPRVNSLDSSDVWVNAQEPLHVLPASPDRVHWRNRPEQLKGEELKKFAAERKKGAGLGLPFAVEMVRRTNVPVGLIPCAHGGTSMAQWDPALKEKGGESLYGSMLRRVTLAGGKVRGVLWYQGESDANPNTAPLFAAKFRDFIAAVRSDFKQPDLPFYYVQLGRHVNNTNQLEWNAVQDAQRLVEKEVKNTGFVAAVDTSLDDGIHVSTGDLKRLGKRLANLAYPQGAKRGPRPESAVYKAVPSTNPNATFADIRVTFSDVNGKLNAEGRPNGFSIHNSAGEPVAMIYRTDLDGPAVVLRVQGKLPDGAMLRYGYGKDPYCNILDSADMAVPVFAIPVR